MKILKADNLGLVKDQPVTYLTVASAVSAGTLTVTTVNGFSTSSATDVKFLLLGEIGEETAEIVRSKVGTAPSGSTITLETNVPAYAHAIGTKVTQIDYNKMEFSGATATGGAKTVLNGTTVLAFGLDGNTTNYHTTAAEDTTYASGYWYYRYKNDINSTPTYSEYSGEHLYSGLPANSVAVMKKRALGLVNDSISELITDEFLLDELNNWQREIQELRNWNWELKTTTQTVVSGQKQYTLPTDSKLAHEARGITQMRIKNYDVLIHIDKHEFDDLMVDKISNTLSADVALIDTTVTLTSSADFASSGTITIGSDDITYTANDTTTGILSGVTGITSTHTSGDTVWQSGALEKPSYWASSEGYYYLYPVASSTYNGLNIYIEYYKQLDDLEDDTSVTEIPFYNLSSYYLAWKIMERRGNSSEAERWRQIYENRTATQMRKNLGNMYFGFTKVRTRGVG